MEHTAEGGLPVDVCRRIYAIQREVRGSTRSAVEEESSLDANANKERDEKRSGRREPAGNGYMVHVAKGNEPEAGKRKEGKPRVSGSSQPKVHDTEGNERTQSLEGPMRPPTSDGKRQ